MKNKLNFKVRFEKQNVVIESVNGRNPDYKLINFLNSFDFYYDNKFCKDIQNLGEKDCKLVYLINSLGLTDKIISISDDGYMTTVKWKKEVTTKLDLEIFNRAYKSIDNYIHTVNHVSDESEVSNG